MCLPAVGLGQTQTCQGGTMACQCKLGPVQGLQELGFPCVKAKLPTGGNEPVPRKPPWQSECAISMQMSPYSQGVSAALAWEHAAGTRVTHGLGGHGLTHGQGGTPGALPADGWEQLTKPSLTPAQHADMIAPAARTD